MSLADKIGGDSEQLSMAVYLLGFNSYNGFRNYLNDKSIKIQTTGRCEKMRFDNDYDSYEMKDYTLDKFIRFIKDKIKENPRQRMHIILYRDDGDMHEFTVSSHMDYSLGVVVKITPDGCIGKECRLKDSGFDKFVAKMLTMGFNAHY